MKQTSNKIAAMPSSVNPMLRAAILAVAVALPSAPATSHAADRTADAIPQSMAIVEVAIVKVEVKLESGKVIQHDGVVFEWGDEGNVVLKYNEHTHDIALKVDKNEDGKKISLTVGYTRDGEAVIAPQTVQSAPKKREVIRIEGGSAIAVTVTPKTMKLDENGNPVQPPEQEKPKDKPKEKAPTPPPPAPEEPKKKPRKITGPDTEDPLEGVK